MSSFINKNANVSQTVLLTSILKPLLENYNKFLLSRDNLNLNCEYHLIPNNNQKYLLINEQSSNMSRSLTSWVSGLTLNSHCDNSLILYNGIYFVF